MEARVCSAAAVHWHIKHHTRTLEHYMAKVIVVAGVGFNLIAPRQAKTECNFGLSERNRVKL